MAPLQQKGVLLYYLYHDLEGKEEAVASWFQERCTQLVGRVRCASDGLNATLGGPLHLLEQHIVEIKVRGTAQ